MRCTLPCVLGLLAVSVTACDQTTKNDDPLASSTSNLATGGDYSACTLSRDEIFASVSGARLRILTRGFAWLDEGVKYSQSASHEGYRTDCSGFVSMCWESGTSYNTTAFMNGTGGATELGSYDELLPGDGIIHSGHAAIFVGWPDQEHSMACVVELASTASNMKFRARLVSSLQSDGARPFRPDIVVGDVGATGGTPPLPAGGNTTPPSSGGGDVVTPPSSGGGDVFVPPSSDGDVSVPPTGGGDVFVPPSSGGDVVVPPSSGGDVFVPPSTSSSGGSYFPSFPQLPFPIPLPFPLPGGGDYRSPGSQDTGAGYPSGPSYPSPSASPGSTAPAGTAPPPPPMKKPTQPSPKNDPVATAPSAADSGDPTEKDSSTAIKPTAPAMPASTGGCSSAPQRDAGTGIPFVALAALAALFRRRERSRRGR
jgi:uncharacterized protein (TIGR03382 family)